MRDISTAPIFLRLGNRARGPKETTTIGKLRRVMISNIVVYNADPKQSSIISGVPGNNIEDVRLSNIRVYAKGGGTKEQAALLPPEKETDYPEPTMFGDLPAYGFFIRHVAGLSMTDIEVSYLKDDARPAFILEDVNGADFHRVKAQRMPNGSGFVLKNVTDFSANQCWPVSDIRIEKVDRKDL
jgi:hypothetical protein